MRRRATATSRGCFLKNIYRCSIVDSSMDSSEESQLPRRRLSPLACLQPMPAHKLNTPNPWGRVPPRAVAVPAHLPADATRRPESAAALAGFFDNFAGSYDDWVAQGAGRRPGASEPAASTAIFPAHRAAFRVCCNRSAEHRACDAAKTVPTVSSDRSCDRT